MERLIGFETYIDEVLIKGYTKDNVKIEYSTSVKEALKLGLIEKEGL